MVNRRMIIRLLLAILICGGGNLLSNTRTVLLHVEQPALPWMESAITQKVAQHLTRNRDLRVVLSERLGEETPPFPHAAYDVDSLIDWGRELGMRYLLVVQVAKERLEIQKKTGIPLLLHRWETVGVVQGEYRLLDLQRGRMLAAEPFREICCARRVIQGDPDNNRDDPDLVLRASEKLDLFDRLENRLAERLATRTKMLMRGR
ncbi:MAG: hypothetical protein JSU65_09675 [Candidatus Zixiibacteriota bacterium]|nr:MAG: hypothetical protein JSU65_09675 [candidate division Zixibacteria bacterium]